MSPGNPSGLALEIDVFLDIQRTAAALMHSVSEALQLEELSSHQYNVLRILRGAGPEGLPCGEIGSRMVTRVPDVTRLVDRLEKRRLVARKRDGADRRVVLVRISRTGLDLLARLHEPVETVHHIQLGHMSERALRTLEALLHEARLHV